MVFLISIQELEATINRIRNTAPPIDGVLSPELRVLAEIYGTMIYEHSLSIDLDQLSESTKLMVLYCLGLYRASVLP
ncbi:DUF3717 domain-containing protein [Massilia sp. DD77]|uniref:DUF3717 domain-containing protein n=1 Tax=Massilia sp. DD77 TaxID=3109349 RepID=UPI003FA55A36